MTNGTEFVDETAGGLSASDLLWKSIDELPLSAFDDDLKRLFVPGGQVLFRENEVADALYVVTAGCLGVIVRDSDGRETLIARICAGETVGEMGLLDGGVRSATVEALRDTELVKLDRASFEHLLKRNPKWLIALFSLLAKRLRDTTRARDKTSAIGTVAVVPIGIDVNYRWLAYDLRETLARHGLRTLLLDRSSAHCSTAEFDAAEAENDMVLYCGETDATPWTKRCLRQADRILLVASPASPSAASPCLTDEIRKLRTPIDLAVLHDAQSNNGLNALEDRLGHLPVDLTCRVRVGNGSDHARLARLLRGKATTLILSAGGARGFAHLGVVRALREAGVPIDLIGGCSMSSIVGAAVAMEWDEVEIKERLHSAFVKSNPMNDYTLPFLSLIKGAKVARRLQQHFGGIRIEDLWRPFFCVSTNLTAGELTVHRSGPLAEALLASISMPGLLPPVIVGRDVHVDGGVMNWLPVDVVGARRGTIVAVDVASDPAPVSFEACDSQFRQFLHCSRNFPPIVDLLLRAATVSSDSLGKTARARADILFKPPLESVDLLDWKACDRAIEIGYRYAIERLDYIDKMGMDWETKIAPSA